MGIKKALGIISIVGVIGLSGCDSNAEKTEIQHADEVFNVEATPKEFKIYLGTNGAMLGRQIRFYDNKGDGKTVDQYVELYDVSFGIPDTQHEIKNLIRPGSKSDYGSIEYAKPMTLRQIHDLDSVYQNLLAGQKNGYAPLE